MPKMIQIDLQKPSKEVVAEQIQGKICMIAMSLNKTSADGCILKYASTQYSLSRGLRKLPAESKEATVIEVK
jgi:hypothetical protein